MTTNDRIYFASKHDELSVSSLQKILPGAREGEVIYSNAWGGWVYGMSQEDFDANFFAVPQETVAELLNMFEPLKITLGDFNDEGLPAFSNGKRWNGWTMPYMTLETIEAAMAEGGFLNRMKMDTVSRFLLVPDNKELLEIGNYEGGEFAPGQAEAIDYDRVLAVYKSHSGEESERIFGEMGLTVYKTPRAVVQEEGKDTPTVVYNIGDGWTWEPLHPESTRRPSTPKP
jgi:hypothetical protein